MSRRKYSDAEKAEALAVLDANNGNKLKAARDLNIPRSSLSEWQNGNGINNDITNLRHGKKVDLANRIDEVVWKIVDAMPDKIEKAGLKDCAISMGTGIDKSALLRNEPTAITATSESNFREKYIQKCLDRGISPEEAEILANRAFAVFDIKDETKQIAS